MKSRKAVGILLCAAFAIGDSALAGSFELKRQPVKQPSRDSGKTPGEAEKAPEREKKREQEKKDEEPSRPSRADPALLARAPRVPSRRGASRTGYDLLAQRWMPGFSNELDLDGDGAPDVWREWASSGQIRSQLISTSYDGIRDLAYVYGADGRVLRFDVDRDRDGVFDMSVSYLETPGKPRRELTVYRDPKSHRPVKWVSVGRVPAGYFEKTIERDTDGDGKPDEVRRYALGPEAWAFGRRASTPRPSPSPSPRRVPMAPPATGSRVDIDEPCLPGTTPEGIPAADLSMLLYRIGDRVEVTGCENFEVEGNGGPGHACTGRGTCFNDRLIEDQVVGALQDGVQCLQRQGARGQQLSYQLLAQVFSSSRRVLQVTCNPADVAATCPGGHISTGEYCGKASYFDDPAYPSFSLASHCGRPESELPATIFHEALHLAGEPGHQHLHHYHDVEEAEIVEPCAQCCLGPFRPGTPQRQAYCDLCTGVSSDPVAHHITMGVLASRRNEHDIAILELEKALPHDPDNLELRMALLDSYVDRYRVQSDDLHRLEEQLLYHPGAAGREPIEARILALKRQVQGTAFAVLDHVDTVYRLRLPASHPRRLAPSARARTGVSDLVNASGGLSGIGTAVLDLAKGMLDADFFSEDYPAGIQDVDARQSSGAADTDAYLRAGPGALERFMTGKYRSQTVLSTCARMSAEAGATDDPAERRARACHRFSSDTTSGMRDAVAAMRAVALEVEASPDDRRSVIVATGTADQMDGYLGRVDAARACLASNPVVPVAECPGARSPRAAAAKAPSPSSGGPACPPPNPFLSD